jgi:hypothetical protein
MLQLDLAGALNLVNQVQEYESKGSVSIAIAVPGQPPATLKLVKGPNGQLASAQLSFTWTF